MSTKKKKTTTDSNSSQLYLYGQAQWSVVLALLWFIWTELCVGGSQEVGFEYVAAATVLRKQSVIQVHFKTGRLEIQCHFWRKKRR